MMAMPRSPRRLRLAALRRLHPVSRRRRAYQRAMQVAMGIGIDGLLSRAVADPLQGPVEGGIGPVLREIGSLLQEPGVTAAVVWPPEAGRGRVYLHLFDRSCRPVAFAKLSLDDANDDRLDHEASILTELSRTHTAALHVPAVLGRATVAGHRVMVTEPLPADAQPIPARRDAFPAACVEAFAGEARHVSGQDLGALSWWPAYRRHLDGHGRAFDKELQALAAGGVAVRRAHGDFGPSNIFETPEGLWVLDWEHSASDAPILADEITFDMGVNARRIATDPAGALREFARRRLRSADDAARREILMALAFRAAAGPRDARSFIRQWGTLP